MRNWRAIEFRLEKIESLVKVMSKAEPREMQIYINILIEYAKEIEELIQRGVNDES